MLPRHPKAKSLIENGLFQDVSRFAELELRIASCEDPQDRQAAFALFVEGLLTTRAIHRAVECWPTGQMPLDARRRLGMPAHLPGADGVFRSLEGEIHAYQLLFRPERDKPLPGESDRFAPLLAATLQPLLITNADHLTNGWKKLKGGHALRGIDLDRLEPRVFQTIRRWLQGAGTMLERPAMPPFHVRTLEQLLTRLGQNEPLTWQLSPGAETELLTLRLIQRLGGRRVVVVVLANLEHLVYTLRQWRLHVGWGDLALVQMVEEPVPSMELDFPVTTHPEGVRRFLAWHHTGARVILVTAHQIPLLARALMGFPMVDLVVSFAPPAGTTLPAAKQLVWQSGSVKRVRGEEVESVAVLPLPRSWKLLLMPVSGNRTDNPLSILLAGIARLAEIRHVHAYLPAVEPNPGDPPEFEWFQIDKEAKSLELERVRLAFQRARRAVWVHTLPVVAGRWLAPADVALFLTLPDGAGLSQALEAILAASHSTGAGCLMVPVWVKDGLVVDASLMWDLLRRMRGLDPAFHAHVRAAMEQLGRDGQCNPEPLLARIQWVTDADQPPSWSRDALFPELLQQLGDVWDQRFGALLAYQATHGDTAVPLQWPDNPELAEWAARQRLAKMRGTLDAEQQARLEKIDFVWNLEQHAWEMAFYRLQRFVEHHGHARVQDPCQEDVALGEWCVRQRQLKKKAKLSSELEQRLEGVGFIWDLEEYAWEESYQLFLRFKGLRGHGKIPSYCPEDPLLAKWADKQRKEKELKKLPSERIKRLDAEGFVWDLAAAAWDEMCEVLRQHWLKYGHGKVPKEWPENPTLAIWSEEQRRLRAKGGLTDERIARLEALDFVWDLKKARWEEGWQLFQEFRIQNGHGRIPDPCPDSWQLDQWAREMRRAWRLGQLDPKIQARMTEAGFVWDLEQAVWEDHFQALVDFHQEYGHFNVPKEWPELPELPTWVKTQRLMRDKEKLDEERLTRLVSLGFVWDARDAAWEEMFLALTRFQQTRNHCLVPTNWESDPALARWVEQQRRDYRLKLSRPEHVQRLESLGFVWDSKAIFWEEMFAALTEYRERHGDCLVSENATEQSQLGWWVAAQRKARLAGQLEPERVQRLDAIGFVWDAQEVIWMESFRALEAFHGHHGHVVVPTDWPENPRLASWVATQRTARQKGHLGEKRTALLDHLGMVWDGKEAIAEEMMQQLRAFHARYGHCEVPLESPEFPRLGLWLQFQRQAKRDGQLDPVRLARLEEIGVTWK
ncbi:MAG: hypothetical protein G8237_10850 [Magnetococcales bacterium]|nr:hypothetical protein [Magnetococcales bacterium]